MLSFTSASTSVAASLAVKTILKPSAIRFISTTKASKTASTSASVDASATPSGTYVTFAEYRKQATKVGQLAAVRQAYPRSLNTQNELERMKKEGLSTSQVATSVGK